MSQLYEKPLPIGKVGNYTLALDSGWLGAETITSVSVTCAGATITLPTSNGNVLQAFFEGDTVGRFEVEWEWATATRSDCYTTVLNIVEC
jgi:hypothetical protein